MKVFIVVSSSGRYDDYTEKIEAVFDTHQSAATEAVRIDAYHRGLKINPPFSEQAEADGILTPEQDKQLNEWRKNYWRGHEYNGCEIVEMELNQPSNINEQK